MKTKQSGERERYACVCVYVCERKGAGEKAVACRNRTGPGVRS